MAKALYIHIPFCEKICAYCDFFRGLYQEPLASKYIETLVLDIEKINDDLKTIYIGGGTPSCLNESLLTLLLKTIHNKQFQLEEFTIEANVESLTKNKLLIMKKYGINRISIGVQSFDQNLLTICHRQHNEQMIKDTIKLIHECGIHNISIDLIYGLPSQSMELWKQDLQKALALDIKHLSLYALTIEPNSYFGRNHVSKCDEDLDADMYEYACKYLDKHGFKQYEIANFALVGYESKHNQMYWNYEDFIGLGLGASGKENHCRYDNQTNFKKYFNHEDMKTLIPLSKEDEMFEMVMMSLRMKKGLNRLLFKQKFHVDVDDIYHEIIHKHILKGNLIINEKYLYCSDQGFIILNDILSDFL